MLKICLFLCWQFVTSCIATIHKRDLKRPKDDKQKVRKQGKTPTYMHFYRIIFIICYNHTYIHTLQTLHTLHTLHTYTHIHYIHCIHYVHCIHTYIGLASPARTPSVAVSLPSRCPCNVLQASGLHGLAFDDFLHCDDVICLGLSMFGQRYYGHSLRRDCKLQQG